MDSGIRYVAGAGALLGARNRWLLLDTVPDPEILDRLASALSFAADRLPGLLADAGVTNWVLVEPDREPLCGGSGTAERAGDVLGLDVGTASARLPLPPSRPAATVAPDSVPGIIDGIPPEILAGGRREPVEAPAEAPEPAPRAEERADTVIRPGRHAAAAAPGSAEADHDGNTVHRGATARSEAPHLRQPTHETVLAVRCPAGHLTPAHAPACRTCQAPVPPQTPQRVPRPRLGGLRLPTGEVVPLDRGVVLGRKPAPVPGGEDWPHLVRLPADETFLSRVHVQIELDGWLVVARDLGSRGGTTLKVPGRQPERIRANEAYVLEPGQALDLADVYEVVFEVDP